MTMTPCLALQGVSKSFGGLRAVNGVTLAVYPGDRKGIIGPNGAGKTTLFNLITGSLQSTHGRIMLFDRDVTNWSTHRRTALGLARTFQITTLFPKLTVLDNVLLAVQGLQTMKFVMWRPLTSYREVYAKAQALLERVGY
jgi:branched-chain amino acid transport system ATP-binding protein